MSIATKTGDDGSTGLLFNRRVAKNDPRVEAYGSCDELNAAIGLAKAHLGELSKNESISWMYENLHQIQKKLIDLMGELATLPSDRDRYQKAGHHFITAQDVDVLTGLVDKIEAQNVKFDGWATPGKTLASAALDVARTTCRRAERRVFALGDEARALNPEVLRFLNRLSDLLWLMARKVETDQNS
jgi:cob(I)alamin adenosyltransferase